MKKLKQYFGFIAKSITDPGFIYKQRKNLDQAGRYFLFIMLLGSVLNAGVLIAIAYNPMTEIYEKFAENTQGISITITDEGVDLQGVEMPYSFAFNAEVNSGGEAVYVDVRPEAEINIKELQEKYKSDFIVISQKSIDAYQSSGGIVQSVPASDFPQEIYGKDLVKLGLDKLSGLLTPKGIFTIWSIMTFVLFFFGTIFKVIYIAIISLIMYLVSKNMKVKFTYKELYISGMYAFTLPYIINHVLPFNIPFVMSGVFIYIMYLVIKHKVNPTKGEREGTLG